MRRKVWICDECGRISGPKYEVLGITCNEDGHTREMRQIEVVEATSFDLLIDQVLKLEEMALTPYSVCPTCENFYPIESCPDERHPARRYLYTYENN